ncbi:hypothetical protein IC1_06281 [Bacillus cereus VD022]|uniref:Uncharacterized protein n=1 Tax=Bacillus cereus TIAC219 TaxID=718222 RepID=A0ABC9SQT7_BACCE|nr:hypothetical protein IC1_06281 [Bacillus cereus VD022]EOQ58020.1 hypothetical protein IAY_06678 [Bacillus cereus TIAC219]
MYDGAFFRGCFNALKLVAPFWLIIGLLVYMNI